MNLCVLIKKIIFILKILNKSFNGRFESRKDYKSEDCILKTTQRL